MKKIIVKTVMMLFVFSTVFYISCNKSDLDLLPHGPTEQSYFTAESDFTKAVLGTYAKMSDLFWYNGGSSVIPVFLLPGDDITTNNSSEEFETFGALQPSSGRVGYFYTTLYQMIARANVVLQKNTEVASGIYITPNLKENHRGEALFLRGLANYYLWNYFGTSPLVTERVTNKDQFNPPNTTGTQLLDQAITDLTEAATLLPATWDAGNRGRATKNSAFKSNTSAYRSRRGLFAEATPDWVILFLVTYLLIVLSAGSKVTALRGSAGSKAPVNFVVA